MNQVLLGMIQLGTVFILLVLAGYLLDRSRFHPAAVASAGVLISFALIQADQFLAAAYGQEAGSVGRVLWLAYPLPAALWVRTVILALPGESEVLDRLWWTLILPVTVLIILGGWAGSGLVDFASRTPGPLFWTLGFSGSLLMLVALVMIHREVACMSPGDRASRTWKWLRIASAGYLGAMLLLLFEVWSPAVVYALFVVDVVGFGLAWIAYEAIAEGQAVRRDLLFVFLRVGVAAAALVLPWVVGLTVAGVWSLPLALALLFVLGIIALGGSLAGEVEALAERGLFRASPDHSDSRMVLRTLLLNTARQPDTRSPLVEMDHHEFVRLTRRALSHMPNLPRLAASPLTGLAVVTQRAGPNATTLERAQELRALLVICIEALRPAAENDAGTTDEWRFYNALYYPYVAGISPYKRSLFTADLAVETRTVIEWFRAAVPQRTMYNWQNRGAELIAEMLLEQERHHNGGSAVFQR